MTLFNRVLTALSGLFSFSLLSPFTNRRTICLIASTSLFVKDLPSHSSSHPTSKLTMQILL